MIKNGEIWEKKIREPVNTQIKRILEKENKVKGETVNKTKKDVSDLKDLNFPDWTGLSITQKKMDLKKERITSYQIESKLELDSRNEIFVALLT